MIQQIFAADLAEMLRRGEAVHLLDVRQPWEHELVALPGSQLIPLGELPDRLSEVAPPDGAALVVYCHHGVRSLRAAALLRQNGHENVYSLAGGIAAWSDEVDPRVKRY